MTTQTELRELLEDAAYAMGFALCDADDWKPDEVNSEGMELISKLELDISWGISGVSATDSNANIERTAHARYSDHGGKLPALLNSSLRVAAAIGKAKREQEAA